MRKLVPIVLKNMSITSGGSTLLRGVDILTDQEMSDTPGRCRTVIEYDRESGAFCWMQIGSTVAALLSKEGGEARVTYSHVSGNSELPLDMKLSSFRRMTNHVIKGFEINSKVQFEATISKFAGSIEANVVIIATNREDRIVKCIEKLISVLQNAYSSKCRINTSIQRPNRITIITPPGYGEH